MKRSERHSIRRIALGLAVAAIVAPATAQGRPMDISGSDSRAIHEVAVPVVGAEDLAFASQPASGPAVVTADSGDGYAAGLGSVGGLALILAAAGAAAVVHHTRKAKLSPA